MAIAALVLGILALIFMLIPGLGFLAVIVSIVGIILGVVGKKQLQAKDSPTGMATAGIVMSIIALALSLLTLIICVACLGAVGGLGALL